ncbi:alpha/beta fold hydrolase [Solimonas sp. K1W22B-7]|uniref:esterase/lipase family protein n=1 Tax=Solimonas sp. K1W22B-7 TaxID=2303331 RepID=UPI000E32F54F|nr:alpha/beta fold hydrolase [Solimonas sp. K1W22B-7]AXQ30865.1 alpha/beta fold hydrolase [Solimonas sp. K1W22B-7]
MTKPSSRDSLLSQVRGALALTGAGLDQITGHVHGFHRAISDIPFKGMAPVPGVNAGSEPVRLIHDGITDGVYGAVRGSMRLVFGAAEQLLREAEKIAPPALVAPNTHRDLAVSALAGFVGDDMAVKRNPLAPRMGFYLQGERLVLDRVALSAAYPDAKPRIVVFIHGLACNESTWDFYSDPEQPETHPYGPRLEQDLDFTPVYLRYNSGLHISRNGARMARHLQRLVERWPRGVQEIVLVGHSMGGLVARAAVAAALQNRIAWADQLSNVICLGSPHLGAPLERWVDAGVRLMRRVPLSRPLAELLHSRSVGVKDLFHGYVDDGDWRGRVTHHDGGGATRIPKAPHARYHFFGCTLGNDEQDLVGRVIGDGLVLLPSSTAAHLADADTAVLFRTNHLRLLNHPVIYGLIRDAVSGRKLLEGEVL